MNKKGLSSLVKIDNFSKTNLRAYRRKYFLNFLLSFLMLSSITLLAIVKEYSDLMFLFHYIASLHKAVIYLTNNLADLFRL